MEKYLDNLLGVFWKICVLKLVKILTVQASSDGNESFICCAFETADSKTVLKKQGVMTVYSQLHSYLAFLFACLFERADAGLDKKDHPLPII